MRAWLAEAQAGPPGASDCKFTVSSNCRCLQGLEGGEHGEAGDYAASASSSTCISGYHRLNTEPNSPYGFFTGGGNERQKARGLLPRVDRRQGQSGLGLEAQQQAVHTYLHGGTGHLVAEYTEVESGTGSAERPALQQAIAAA